MNEEVFTFLSRQVEQTRLSYEEAKRHFWEIAGKPREWPEMDTGRPRPDGSELFRRIIAHEKFTMKAHLEAVIRLNRFLTEGTIPEDVQEKIKKADGSST